MPGAADSQRRLRSASCLTSAHDHHGYRILRVLPRLFVRYNAARFAVATDATDGIQDWHGTHGFAGRTHHERRDYATAGNEGAAASMSPACRLRALLRAIDIL